MSNLEFGPVVQKEAFFSIFSSVSNITYIVYILPGAATS